MDDFVKALFEHRDKDGNFDTFGCLLLIFYGFAVFTAICSYYLKKINLRKEMNK